MTSYWPSHVPVKEDTLFDIGSMTKAVATVSILARLFEKKKITLQEKVEGFTLYELLTHSSGLKAWLPLYQMPNRAYSKEWVGTQSKGTSIYSDLGFLLIHEYLKEHFGNVDLLFHEEVKTPLKLQSTDYNPKASSNIVATEYCHYRKKMVQGEVFDENTAALGGVSTHAGLFSTASDVSLWGREWLKARAGKSDWLSKETATLFSSKQKGNWALGFDTKSESGSTLGSAFSLNTFGHLGYPGTSVWMDPENSAVVVFLTNRIHPSRLDERIKTIRPKVHELVFQSLKEKAGA